MTHLVSFTGVISPDVEDGGMAMIAELSESLDSAYDDCMFVRIQSYDENCADSGGMKIENSRYGHPLMNSIVGKKVRVSIEVLD